MFSHINNEEITFLELKNIIYSGRANHYLNGIAVGGSAYAIGFAFSLIRFDFVGLISTAALGYPHYFLIKEINAGIMTDYNYHNVAYCCGRA